MQSDRDVSGQVPINFVPHPGIYVTRACFQDGVYGLGATQECISNLLASQIRRYIFDIYWDPTNQRFGLCPVQVPSQSTNTSQALVTSAPGRRSPFDPEGSLMHRQALNFTNASTPTTQSITASSIVSSSSPTSTAADNDILVQLGPYQCSETLSLNSVTTLFYDYLQRTANTLEAKIHIWILHLHVAATPQAPTSPPPPLDPSQLPGTQHLVRTYFEQLDNMLYTPGSLLTDRANLNSSWYRTSNSEVLPLANYFDVNRLSNGDLATDDGWPNENYIQFSRGKRMLVSFGEFDSQFRNYNDSVDGDRIFPRGYLSAPREIALNSSGQLESGCFYNGDQFQVSQVNNSWATVSINMTDPPDLGMTADNLTVCGISPILNTTINNQLADTSAGPYQDFGNEAVFSWAYGEPRNDSSNDVDFSAKFRCALMVSNDTYKGHWRVEYCSQSYHVACREANMPYEWRISYYKVPFTNAQAACTGNTTFDVPRAGLENIYLYNQILTTAAQEQDDSVLNGVWLNFNSLDVQSCWVTNNNSCPYYENTDATHSRQVLIPTIAALIVLILTVLTILVKCTTNRHNSRTRRRGDGGWDYEGVPS